MSKEEIVNIETLRHIFNNHKDKLLCTSNNNGEPNVCIMGNPKINENGDIEFIINGTSSVTLDNLKENKNIFFMVFTPGERAKDYKGVRIQARADEVHTSGGKFEDIKSIRREKLGEARAAELLAYVICKVQNLRPIVDRGQAWTDAP
ncbi:MAG: pyridoxamine 5'-phosphate oxidase family protein [Solitalea-like symbiont of Tyrophagus putrescentiae]